MATAEEQVALFGRTLKEGERLLAPTMRPDGTLRKPIRIRAGYVPQDEVAIYQSKGALLRKSMPEVPPGYDPELDAKPKTKSAKRNERKKEKKHQQAALASSSADKEHVVERREAGERSLVEDVYQPQDVDALTNQVDKISLSSKAVPNASPHKMENTNSRESGPDLEKRIRALKKKIRLTEALKKAASEKDDLKPEQLEKLSKLDSWYKELAEMEYKNSPSA
ncbi:partner of Y14 and mago [Nymphaea colorata]|nr:partner of Y14 and mago [Nymphaea colorata]